MTRSIAVVLAITSLNCAWLLALIARSLTASLVTCLQTSMIATFQRFTTTHSTAERALITWNCFALLVSSKAPLGSKEDTGWTVRCTMTVMTDWMIALVCSCAFVLAFWHWNATVNRWIDYGASTLTSQLIERDSRTRNTISNMTISLTAMLSTR